MLALTDCRRWRVLAPDGTRLGRLGDLEVSHDERLPRITQVVAGRHPLAIPWEAVIRFERDGVVVDPALAVPVGQRTGLLLARDLLDAQVVDIRGRRLARVGEIELEPRDGALYAVAVDVGLASVARRLGLRRLAGHLPTESIAWDAIHFTSGRAHEIQLRSPAAAVHHLEPAELAQVVARLPAHSAEQVFQALPRERAAAVRAAAQSTARARGGRHFRRVMSARPRAPS